MNFNEARPTKEMSMSKFSFGGKFDEQNCRGRGSRKPASRTGFYSGVASHYDVWYAEVITMWSMHFYPRDAMLARVFATATCPSVYPSRAGIVSKRRKLASWFLHHLVAPWLYFSVAKFHPDILRGSPWTGASNKGRSEKLSDFLVSISLKR